MRIKKKLRSWSVSMMALGDILDGGNARGASL